MTATSTIEINERLRAVPAPAPVLSRAQEDALTPRQREILSQLGEIFSTGFADLTMADLASRLNCSLSSLYGLAPSRDQLVMMVVDRNLRTIGRSAHSAIATQMSPLEAVTAYLAAATVAVSNTNKQFATDMAQIAAGRQLNEDHSNYLVDITRCLLDIAVERGEIEDVDTAAVSRMIAGLGRDFARPEVMAQLRTSPKIAADAMVEVVLDGLRRNP